MLEWWRAYLLCAAQLCVGSAGRLHPATAQLWCWPVTGTAVEQCRPHHGHWLTAPLSHTQQHSCNQPPQDTGHAPAIVSSSKYVNNNNTSLHSLAQLFSKGSHRTDHLAPVTQRDRPQNNNQTALCFRAMSSPVNTHVFAIIWVMFSTDNNKRDWVLTIIVGSLATIGTMRLYSDVSMDS